jgi:hypothetical protein
VTLKESQNWLENEQRLSISIPTMDKFIRQKLGSRYKKQSPPASSSARMLLAPVHNGKPGKKVVVFPTGDSG